MPRAVGVKSGATWRIDVKADRNAALHDVLTGLPNRALFIDRLEHGIAQAKRHGWTLAVMFVDLDDFKTINDTHGHEVGDGVLRTIATRLKDGTRSDDTVSRLGGDEFLYLLMEIRNKQDASSIAQKIIAAIHAPCEIGLHDRTVRLTVEASIGIAVFPSGGQTVEALIKSADTALYRAKRSRSGYSFAS
jgi:diguanylate cyclase (GGDEF)-like protein